MQLSRYNKLQNSSIEAIEEELNLPAIRNSNNSPYRLALEQLLAQKRKAAGQGPGGLLPGQGTQYLQR